MQLLPIGSVITDTGVVVIVVVVLSFSGKLIAYSSLNLNMHTQFLLRFHILLLYKQCFYEYIGNIKICVVYITYILNYFCFRRKSQICPIDLSPLTIEDLFPDNYTKREIDEQKVACLNTGCDVTIPLLEADQHYASCGFSKNQVS